MIGIKVVGEAKERVVGTFTVSNSSQLSDEGVNVMAASKDEGQKEELMEEEIEQGFWLLDRFSNYHPD